MRILIACEFSGIVREAFNRRGHDAWSVDLLPSEQPGQHIQGDVLDILSPEWDMLIAFPPCTYLTRAGAQHYQNTPQQYEALMFVFQLLEAPIERIALENPVGVISTRIEKPTQIIQPYMFGHPETKQTCLWLDNLPKLRPTNIVKPEGIYKANYLAPSPDRWRERSRTYTGIADAMAEQWG